MEREDWQKTERETEDEKGIEGRVGPAALNETGRRMRKLKETAAYSHLAVSRAVGLGANGAARIGAGDGDYRGRQKREVKANH